jgi:hypothetical protein
MFKRDYLSETNDRRTGRSILTNKGNRKGKGSATRRADTGSVECQSSGQEVDGDGGYSDTVLGTPSTVLPLRYGLYLSVPLPASVLKQNQTSWSECTCAYWNSTCP